MKTALLQRWLATLATGALLLAISAYLAHQHQAVQKVGGADSTCELCLQLSTAVAPPAKRGPTELLLRVWQPLPADTSAVPRRAIVHAYLSRAPPHA